MSRLGKIARLPREIRDQLNVRLSNGEVGRQLVDWLNGLPEAQAVLAAQFGGRPINGQNLTEWKQGGYEDWLRHQEDCIYARLLSENARELEKEAGGSRLEDRLAAPMALALARVLREADEPSDGAENQRTVLGVARELAQLRRSSNDAERVRLDRERWETKQAEVNEENVKRAEREAIWKRVKTQRPDLFPDPMQRLGMLPQELQLCLEASTRLRRAQSGAGGSQDGALPETQHAGSK